MPVHPVVVCIGRTILYTTVVHRSFCLTSSTLAVSEIASRRWWCIESLFPVYELAQLDLIDRMAAMHAHRVSTTKHTTTSHNNNHTLTHYHSSVSMFAIVVVLGLLCLTLLLVLLVISRPNKNPHL